MKEILKPALVLFVITCVASGVIALASAATSGIVAENDLRAQTEAISAVLPEGVDAVSYELRSTYDGKHNYHEYFDESGERAACVIEVETVGYGGKMKIFVGLNADGVISGVDIVSHAETPSLGAEIEKPKFIDQFIGKSGGLTLVKRGASGSSEIDAVTAATISSKAVTDAVNSALAFYEETVKGGDR